MYWYAHMENGPQRVNHAAAAVGEKIFSFGGFSSTWQQEYVVERNIDIYVLDTEIMKWAPLYYKHHYLPRIQCRDTVPFKCYGHTVVAFEKNIYLWGGRNNVQPLNRLYCFDTENSTWSCPAVSGSVPLPVDGHSACVIGDYMYIFGGFEEQSNELMDQLYRINLRTFVWELVRTKGIPPKPREFHTASAIGSRMYIYGGSGTSIQRQHLIDRRPHYSDLLYIDSTTMTWFTPVVSGPSPGSRRSHSAVVYDDRLYILFGYDNNKRAHHNDIREFNPETNCWTKINAKGHLPRERRRQCCCVIGHSMYLFGGTSPIRYGCANSLAQENDDEEDDSKPEDAQQTDKQLVDLSDVNVLDFNPTLRRLCLYEIVIRQLNFESLPTALKNEIYFLKSIK